MFVFPQVVQNKQCVRWKTKQSFDGQLYQEYSYQNLLKLDHFSSSYDEKNFGVFFMPHSVFVFVTEKMLAEYSVELQLLHYVPT